MVAENQDQSEDRQAVKQITVVVFASDQGPGDAERTAIMSLTGNILAKQKAKIICLAQNDLLPLPLLTSAHLAGADIELICDKDIELPTALQDIDKTIIESSDERHKVLAQVADCFVGLPGSLASSTSFFLTIADLGATKPMVFLNKNRAFEILRGICVDVLAHSFHKAHRNIQFVETVDEIWPKVEKLTGRH